MKFSKIIIAILAVSMLFTFASCSEQTTEETTTDSVAGETVEIVTEDETTANTTETTTQAETETTTAETTTAETTTAKETTTQAKTTTTTTTTTTAPAEKSVADIAASIAGKTSIFEEQLSKSSSSRALTLFGISASDVEEAAYYAASAAVAEEVLVVKASSSSAVSSIKSAMESRRSTQIEDYADYVPKEVAKLESAVIYTSGDYIVFCVSNNNSSASSTISGLF